MTARSRCLAILGAVALAVAPARAQDERPALLELLGPTALQIPIRDVAHAAITTQILARQGKEPPVLILTRMVRLADKSEAGWTKAFTFKWVPDAGSEYGQLQVVVQPSLLPKTGEYTVTARAVGAVPAPSAGQSANAKTDKASEPKKQAEQAISMTFTRPPAVLSVQSPIKMEVVLGDLFSGTTVTPAEITLAEGSGDKAIADLTVSSPEPLKRVNGLATEGRVSVTGIPLEPGVSKPTAIAVTGAMPLGTASGKLLFTSPQLAQPLAVTVEVLVRVWRGWLLAVIALGIVLGYQIRVRLDRDVLDATAREGANRQIARLVVLAAGTRDTPLRTRIQTIEITLRRAMGPDALPAAITAAAETATKDVDEALKGAEKERADLRAAIAEAKAALGDETDHLPAVAEAVEKARAALVKAEALAKQGFIADVHKALDAEKAIVNGEVAGTIATAARGVAATVRPLEPWGERTLDTAKERVLAQVSNVDSTEGAGKIRRMLELARELRDNLFGRGLEDVRAVATTSREALLPREAAAVDRVLTEMPDFSRREPDAAALREFEETVRRLRGLLAQGLRAAADALTPKLEVATLLDAGKFDAAARAIVAARPVPGRALGPRPDAVATAVAFPATRDAVNPRRAAERLPFTLTTDPLVAIMGSAVEVVLTGAALPPDAAVNWTVATELQDTHETRLRVTPAQLGSMTVTADVVRNGTVLGTAQIDIDAQPPASVEAEQQRQRRLSADRQRTFWAGVLICGAGYFIYEETFVGTVRDLFVAFLWGFSVDVGFAKVLQFTSSKSLT